MQGGAYEGFGIHAGVRQGCPLSPLVYALAAESLMDTIEMICPQAYVRAYADDTAVLLTDYFSQSRKLARVFSVFAEISNLHLNLKKSYIIPLRVNRCSTIERDMRRCEHPWTEMKIDTTCKYLGFYVGPGKSDKSWEGPIKKFRAAVNRWLDHPIGLQFGARVYNVFAIFTLMYVAQLETPPGWVLQETRQALWKVAKGPYQWASEDDLWTLKEAYNFPLSFKNMEWSAIAAKIRVHHNDEGCLPHCWCELAERKLLRCVEHPEARHSAIAWKDWYGKAYLSNLGEARRSVDSICNTNNENRGIEMLRKARRKTPKPLTEDKTWRKEVQKAAYAMLLARHANHPMNRIRHKLERWKLGSLTHARYFAGNALSALPARIAPRVNHNLKLLGKFCPPCVQAACISLVWNRWCTNWRFQKHSGHECLLGCGQSNGDRVEHYAVCQVTKQTCRQKLNLDDEKFASLPGLTLAHPEIKDQETLVTIALLTYGIYKVTNARRKDNTIPTTDSMRAILQAVHYGVRGHTVSTKIFDNRWADNTRNKDLPVRDHIPWDPMTTRMRTILRRH